MFGLKKKPQDNPYIAGIKALAKELEWNIDIRDERMIAIPFDLGEGRDQTVWVFHVSEKDDKNMIDISSPAMCIDGLPDKMLGQKAANELLRENAKIAHAAWAIETISGEEERDYLVAIRSLILESISAGDFANAVLTVANMADDMEKKLGVDNF